MTPPILPSCIFWIVSSGGEPEFWILSSHPEFHKYLVKDAPPIAPSRTQPSDVPSPRDAWNIWDAKTIFYCFTFDWIDQNAWFLNLKALLNIVGMGIGMLIKSLYRPLDARPLFGHGKGADLGYYYADV